MLTWKEVISFATKGNTTPDKRVEKTEKEWNDIPVVITGGLGKVIGGIAKVDIIFDDDLTLKGLFHLYKDLN